MINYVKVGKGRIGISIKHYWPMFFCAMATFVWIARQIRNPYVIDEAAFPYAANGVATNGTPYFYNGETRPMDLGIWHPPLYVYLLGGWIKIFGFGHVQIRAFGVLCAVITCVLIYTTVKLFSNNAHLPAALAVGFYSTHYFVVASTLVPDIDGTLEPLVLALSFFSFARILMSKTQISSRNFAEITIALGISFSTKLTTPLLLALPLYFVFKSKKGGWVKSAFYTIIQMLSGLGFFLLWWIPLSSLKNLDWTYPFRFTIQSVNSKNGGGFGLETILKSAHMPLSAISWIGFPSFLLYAFLIYIAIKKSKSVVRTYALILLIFSGTTWLVYDSITGAPFTFPKYWNIGLLGISISIGLLFPDLNIRKIEKLDLKSSIILLSYAGIIFSAVIWSVSRHLKMTHNFVSFNQSHKVYTFIFIIFCITIFLIHKYLSNGLFLTFFIATVIGVVSINSAINSVISNAHFSTRYYFGETGMKPVLKWIANNSTRKSILFSAKDIGLESGLPFYEDAQVLGSIPTAEIAHFLEMHKINLIVIRNLYDYSLQVYPTQLSAAVQGFSKIAGNNFGDFQVWERSNGK